MNTSLLMGARSGDAARGRKALVAVAAVVAFAVPLLWPTFQSLARAWNDTAGLTYTHGWLVALVCAWLLVRACRRYESTALDPYWPAAAALACTSLAWLVLLRAGIQIGHQ